MSFPHLKYLVGDKLIQLNILKGKHTICFNTFKKILPAQLIYFHIIVTHSLEISFISCYVITVGWDLVDNKELPQRPQSVADPL